MTEKDGMNYWRFSMWKDKIVEDVKKNREKLFARFDYDIKKFSAFIIEEQTIRQISRK